MPVTLTIKQVPEAIAEKLRLRAAASHRSLQGELMAILEAAALGGSPQARQPEPSYTLKHPSGRRQSAKNTARAERLTLAELWDRARRLGPPSATSSTAILRSLRDERHGR